MSVLFQFPKIHSYWCTKSSLTHDLVFSSETILNLENIVALSCVGKVVLLYQRNSVIESRHCDTVVGLSVKYGSLQDLCIIGCDSQLVRHLVFIL